MIPRLKALRSLRWNEDKLRAQVAVRLIDTGRYLLRLRGGELIDFDRCIHCNAPGCESGEVEHRPDCPSVTGVYPVRLKDMWPGGMFCGRCQTPLWPGDQYSHIPLTPEGAAVPVVEVACTGCALLALAEQTAIAEGTRPCSCWHGNRVFLNGHEVRP